MAIVSAGSGVVESQGLHPEYAHFPRVVMRGVGAAIWRDESGTRHESRDAVQQYTLFLRDVHDVENVYRKQADMDWEIVRLENFPKSGEWARIEKQLGKSVNVERFSGEESGERGSDASDQGTRGKDGELPDDSRAGAKKSK